MCIVYNIHMSTYVTIGKRTERDGRTWLDRLPVDADMCAYYT